MTTTSEQSAASAPLSDAMDEVCEVLRIGPEDWLIRDRRFDEHDARHVVACVRERGVDRVEVLWLRSPHLPTTFGSVWEAAEAFFGEAISSSPGA